MTGETVICPKCLHAQSPPPGAATAQTEHTCARCQASLAVETFPRLNVGAAAGASPAGQVARDGEAVCRFYPELQAETICGECGCYLSLKASVEWGGRTLCMPCLHQLREARGADAFSAKRTLHDNVGLGLVLLLAPLSLFTGPIAVFYLLRHRKEPRGLVPRGEFRWWLALILALAVTAGWVFLFVIWIAMIVRAVTA